MAAALCPNPACNYKLKITDWKQTCPKCGTNILYYKMEERLEAEADIVETKSAVFQKKMDRGKAAIFGNKLAIARMVLLSLPLFLLFLPLGQLIVHAPFIKEMTHPLNAYTIAMGAMGIFDNVDALLAYLQDPVVSAVFLWQALGIISVVLVFVAILAGLITCFLQESRLGFLRSMLFSLLGLGGSALGAVSLLQMGAAGAVTFPGAITASIKFLDFAGLRAFASSYSGSGFMDFLRALWDGVAYFHATGLYLVIACFAALIAINIYNKVKGGVPVVNKQCYISGFPEEEVHAALAQGLTLHDMRARRAEEEAAAKAAAEEAGEAPEEEAMAAE